MQEQNNVVIEENEVKETTESTAEITETVKTFTQDEVNEIINKRLARERKDIELKIEKERKEAEELSRLSEAERQKKLFEKQVKEFEETKRAFENERLLNETTKQLANKNLPVQFAQLLKGDTAESTFENIKIFEEQFKSALEDLVNERLKGKVPKAAIKGNVGVTKEAFNKMSYEERVELFNKNQELYEELTK